MPQEPFSLPIAITLGPSAVSALAAGWVKPIVTITPREERVGPGIGRLMAGRQRPGV